LELFGDTIAKLQSSGLFNLGFGFFGWHSVDCSIGICQFLDQVGVCEVKGDWIEDEGRARNGVGRVPDLPETEMAELQGRFGGLNV